MNTAPVLSVARRRALVVDDDQNVRQVLEQALTRAGYDVNAVGTGRAALRATTRRTPEVVLLDRHLPDLCGQQVLERLRLDPRTSAAVVVMMSGDDVPDDRVRSFDLGADDWIGKPLQLQELLARVRTRLSAHDRWLTQLETDAALRAEVAHRLVDLDPARPLAVTVRALGTILATGFGVSEVVLRGTDGTELAPTSAVGPPAPHLAGAASAPHEPQLERRADGTTTVHVPLQRAARTFAVLSASTRWSAEPTLAALIDLTPQLSTLLLPGVEAGVAWAKDRFWLEQRLTRDGMWPVFQPVVSLQDGRVVGYEGLTRFAGGAAPDEVFAMATRLGVGATFQLEAARRILDAATDLPPQRWVSLNLSATTVLHPGLCPLVEAVPRELRLEITEHELVADYEAVATAIGRLESVSLGVDDAGSGYASLRHVYELRPRMVKLDRGWVAGIDRDPVRQAMVRGLLSFTDAIGASLVGEGVEREQERATLAELGVPLGQGYLFGRPTPIAPTSQVAR